MGKKIQSLMWDCVGLARNAEGLERALTEFKKMQIETIPHIGVTTKVKVLNREWQEYLEIRNMAELAEVMARCAMLRTESRGAHYRSESGHAAVHKLNTPGPGLDVPGTRSPPREPEWTGGVVRSR